MDSEIKLSVIIPLAIPKVADTNIGDRNTNARSMEYNVTPKALEDKNNDGTINAADDALLQPDDDFGFNEGITYHGQ